MESIRPTGPSGGQPLGARRDPLQGGRRVDAGREPLRLPGARRRRGRAALRGFQRPRLPATAVQPARSAAERVHALFWSNSELGRIFVLTL